MGHPVLGALQVAPLAQARCCRPAYGFGRKSGFRRTTYNKPNLPRPTAGQCASCQVVVVDARAECSARCSLVPYKMSALAARTSFKTEFNSDVIVHLAFKKNFNKKLNGNLM